MFAGHCEWATLFITDPRTGPLTPWVGGRICLVPAGDRVGWGGGRHVTNPPFSIPPPCRFPPDFPKFFNYIYIYNSTFVRSNSKSCDQGEGGRREKNDTVSNIISGIDSLTTYSAACDNVISEMTHETRKYTECTMSLSYHWRIAWRYICIHETLSVISKVNNFSNPTIFSILRRELQRELEGIFGTLLVERFARQREGRLTRLD